MADVLCPVVVGRVHELEVLGALLDAARGGTGSVVVLLGEAGIGKSRLARELVTVASAADMVVLRGRAVPGVVKVPFRPLAEALAPLADDLAASADSAGAALEAWLPVLAAVVPGLGSQQAAPADGSDVARGEAVVRALAALANGRGGLLVLEDLHWADPDTLAIVEHLTDNLDRVPVLCVVTVRSEEVSGGRDLVRVVASRRSARVLELSRLDDAQVAAMVDACTDGAGVIDLQRILSTAEGVPFLVEELLASPGMPATFAETVQRRLEALDETPRSVLASAATLGRHFDWRLLPAATGLDEATVADALERALGAQLLQVEGDGFRFRHALTREAVVDSVLPPRRAALASAALAALDDARSTLEGNDRELAAALAERAEQYERAGALFFEIGVDALETGALASAAVSLGRATQLLAPGAARVDAALALVDAFAHAGRVDEALDASDALLGGETGEPRAIAHLRVARAALTTARWDLARAQLAAGRRQLGERPRLELLAELSVLDGELALGVGDVAGALERAADALTAAEAAGAASVACEALLLRGRAARASSLEDAHAAFADAAVIAEAHHLPVWRLRSLHELGTIDMLERGEGTLLEQARSLAEDVGAVATATVLDIELCATYLITGDDERSIAHGRAATDRARHLGQAQAAAAALLLLGTAYIVAGDPDAAGEAAELARRLDDSEVLDASLRLAVEGISALLDEDRTAATAIFDVGMTRLRTAPASPPASWKGLWPLLLAVERRDQEAADAIVDVAGSGATVNRLNLGYLDYAGAVLSGRRAPDEAAVLAADGDQHLKHGPFWHQLGRRLVAEAAVADGWGDALTWALEAGAYFDGRGHNQISAACAALTARSATMPRSRPDWAFADLGVTRREADVLVLVREGLANKEIADRLYLSPRTVEKHVESLLRKTAARSRTHLATLAAQSDSGAL